MNKQLYAVLVLLVISSLLFVACGNTAPTSAPEPTQQQETAQQQEPTEVEEPTAVEEPPAATEPAEQQATVEEPTEAPAPTAAEEHEPVSLTFWTFEHESYVPMLETIIDEFMAAYPYISVKVETYPFADYFNTLTVAAAGEEMPDVMLVDQPWSAILAEQGLSMPLDSFISEESKADIVPYGISGATYKDEIWSLPLEESGMGIWYNKALFEQAGIPLPSSSVDEGWTYSQFLEAAKALTKDTDGDGVLDQWGWYDIFQGSNEINTVGTWIWSLGSDFISPDGTTTEGYLNGPAAVKAFTDLNALYTTDQIAPSQPLVNFVQDWMDGKIAMISCISRLHAVMASLGVDYGVTVFPWADGGVPVTLCGAWNVAISSQTENPEEAYLLTDWITNQQGMERGYEIYPGLPARQSVLDNHPELFEYPLGLFTEMNVRYCRPRPQTPVWPVIQYQVQTAINDIRAGADVQETLDALAEASDAALEAYK